MSGDGGLEFWYTGFLEFEMRGICGMDVDFGVGRSEFWMFGTLQNGMTLNPMVLGVWDFGMGDWSSGIGFPKSKIQNIDGRDFGCGNWEWEFRTAKCYDTQPYGLGGLGLLEFARYGLG